MQAYIGLFVLDFLWFNIKDENQPVLYLKLIIQFLGCLTAPIILITNNIAMSVVLFLINQVWEFYILCFYFSQLLIFSPGKDRTGFQFRKPALLASLPMTIADMLGKMDYSTTLKTDTAFWQITLTTQTGKVIEV
ncbi:MAG: hypothetical protein QM800_09645 [Paludibacter sp.]